MSNQINNTTKGATGTWIIVIVILIVIAFGIYWLATKPASAPVATNQTPTPSVLNPATLSPLVATPFVPIGKIVKWISISWGEKEYKFEHYCDGSVKQFKEDQNLNGVASTVIHYYCLGRNQLVLDSDDKLLLIKDETISDVNKTPLLLDVKLLPSSSVLISYSASAYDCRTDNCGSGIGMPDSNYVTIVFNLADNTFRNIKNYPSYGNAIWNKSVTKAVFYPETCGGRGCDERAIFGYNLLTDESKDITSEKAAYDYGQCSNGKNCWANCGSPASGLSGKCLSVWNNLHWVDDNEVSATIINPSGEKKEIVIIF